MRDPARRLTAALLALAAVACAREAPEDAAADEPVRVVLQEARLDSLRDTVSAPGIVVPSTAGDWTVVVTEPAEILELPRAPGDAVAVGDLLVRLDIASLSQERAAAELAQLQAANDLDRAKSDAQQAQSLFERGLIARLEHEARQADLASAEARLRQATARFEAVKADESRTVIRARFAGTVTDVWHAPGDLLAGRPDDPILRVIDPTRVQVAVQLPVAQVARIQPGQLASVRSFAGETSELATVASRADTSDPNAPTAEVRLAFTQPATLPLDTPVSVEIVFDQRAGVLVVPMAAVMADAQGTYVVVAGEDGRAHRRDVRVGLRTRELAHIVTGLEPGERVVVSGAGEILEGTPIAPAR